jgi:hypothetical protein
MSSPKKIAILTPRQPPLRYAVAVQTHALSHFRTHALPIRPSSQAVTSSITRCRSASFSDSCWNPS